MCTPSRDALCWCCLQTTQFLNCLNPVYGEKEPIFQTFACIHPKIVGTFSGLLLFQHLDVDDVPCGQLCCCRYELSSTILQGKRDLLGGLGKWSSMILQLVVFAWQLLFCDQHKPVTIYWCVGDTLPFSYLEWWLIVKESSTLTQGTLILGWAPRFCSLLPAFLCLPSVCRTCLWTTVDFHTNGAATGSRSGSVISRSTQFRWKRSIGAWFFQMFNYLNSKWKCNNYLLHIY